MTETKSQVLLVDGWTDGRLFGGERGEMEWGLRAQASDREWDGAKL